MRITVEKFGTDVYFNMIRASIRLMEHVGCDSHEEDFEFFLQFDPNNKPPAAVFEDWVEEKKKVARERFLSGGSIPSNTTSPSSVGAGDSPSPEAIPANEVQKDEVKRGRGRPPKAKEATTTTVAGNLPPVESSVCATPDVPVLNPDVPTAGSGDGEAKTTDDEKTVPGSTLPEVSVAAAPVVIVYDKTNPIHAKEIQKVLDATDSTWKKSAASIEFAKKIVGRLHGNYPLWTDGILNGTVLQLVASSYKAKDLGLWDAYDKSQMDLAAHAAITQGA
jgi:hypothetical protein